MISRVYKTIKIIKTAKKPGRFITDL